MYSRLEVKQAAKEQIKGTLGVFFICYVILVAIQLVVGMIPVAGTIAAMIFSCCLSLALIRMYLTIIDGGQIAVGDLFSGFQVMGRAIGVYLSMSIYVFLWSLLLVIPGIIKGYSYFLAPYLVVENPDMTPSEAIKESMRLMDGHKMDAFVLQLSFYGWMLVTAFTFGLAGIYTIPYMNAAYANFYRAIAGNTQKALVNEDVYSTEM